MKVEFEFELGEKVFLRGEASKGKLCCANIVAASVFLDSNELKKYYRTDSGFNGPEKELAHESEALDLASNYYISQLDSINALRNLIAMEE